MWWRGYLAGQLRWTAAAVEEAYATPRRLWLRDASGNVLSVPWHAGKVPASKAQLVARAARALAVHDNVGAYTSSAPQPAPSWPADVSPVDSHRPGGRGPGVAVDRQAPASSCSLTRARRRGRSSRSWST